MRVGLAAALLAASGLAFAQQTESRIIGTVTDPNGGILPGASVTVTSAVTGASRTTVSDAQGRYTVTNLTPGTYQVLVELSGFAPYRRDGHARRSGMREPSMPAWRWPA